MIRKYKALGLAMMALFAFGAFAAQSATAKPLTVPTNLTKVFLTGTQEEKTTHVFSTPNGNVTCKHSAYRGSGTAASGVVNEVTLTPEYKECTAFGFATAHITTTGCTYTLTTATAVSAGVVTWGGAAGQIHVVCTAGNAIKVTPTSFGVSVCTQSIEEQTPTSGHIVGRNAVPSTPMHITDEVTVEGVHYKGTGGVCGSGETNTNAKYEGKTTTLCYSDAAHTIRVDCTFS